MQYQQNVPQHYYLLDTLVFMVKEDEKNYTSQKASSNLM